MKIKIHDRDASIDATWCRGELTLSAPDHHYPALSPGERGVGLICSLVECLPNTYEALDSIPRTERKQQSREERREREEMP